MKVYEIIEATNGVLLSGDSNTPIYGFCQDTRKLQPGDMYIALIGENSDGHDYIQQAMDAGAIAVLTSKKVDYPNSIVIQVEDTLLGLQDMARYVRTHREMKVIGITGSVGKTSTKDMVYSVMKQKYKTLKTLGNYNNEIGLPLTILRHSNEEVVILEMGMNHLREMAHLSSIATPDIAIITNVGTAHIGEVGSRENILKAKLEILEYMEDNTNVILNVDNDMLSTVQLDNHPIISVSLEKEGLDPIYYETSSDFQYHNQTIHVPVAGKHFITNALLALALGELLDIPFDLCKKGIEEFKLTKNRMDIHPLDNDIQLIDGTYNASEESMKSSLDVLKNYQTRRIAVLGDMLELGDYSKELHLSVGKHASACCDVLFCIGTEATYIAQGAMQEGMKDVFCVATNVELYNLLKEYLEPKDICLLKASNGMKLKEIVIKLMEG
ncbi:UDP-N-acetylmuramoyl-tripeptide--D-alanyl-D-alanine ligase [Tannockella kyphosi]|uniref:UDP-N-acetylmuramoyl-tripeptide--D-alanyl-D- alanine ligase n=1 Tax=Tannockella kyphosi TaxID=2899121 RepID=UPI00201145F2|nr:UDP-N-acetylmuramoyl-tripeptide--D-alanyl-D-alanine ligase [Tannockella kyphosi]